MYIYIHILICTYYAYVYIYTSTHINMYILCICVYIYMVCKVVLFFDTCAHIMSSVLSHFWSSLPSSTTPKAARPLNSMESLCGATQARIGHGT